MNDNDNENTLSVCLSVLPRTEQNKPIHMSLYKLDFLLSLELSASGCHHIYEGAQGLAQ